MRNAIIFTMTYFMSFSISAFAAQTAVVTYPYLGIQFSIPDGWQGTESGDVFVMGSNTQPGLLAVMLNEATRAQQLKTEADRGITDEGIQLTRSGEFVKIGAEGLGAEFTGFVDGAKAKAFITGLINPFGSSVSVVAVTTEELYSEEYKNLALKISNSVGFAVPEESVDTKNWREGLGGKRLTHMYSSSDSGSTYYDSSGTMYGSYSSYNTTSKFDLCSDGSFSYYSSSQSSFDNSGGYGSVSGGNESSGSWKVITTADGGSSLMLEYPDGGEREFELSYGDGKTLLNGTRYFRTQSEVCH